MEERETLRMVCGEALPEIYKRINSEIRKAVYTRNAGATVIAGPIFAMDEHESNHVLYFAGEGLIDLWIPGTGIYNHFAIFGESRMISEEYHEPLAREREIDFTSKFYDDGEADESSESYILHECIQFDNMVNAFGFKRLPESDCILATEETIMGVKEENEMNYCFLYPWEFAKEADGLGMSYKFRKAGKI